MLLGVSLKLLLEMSEWKLYTTSVIANLCFPWHGYCVFHFSSLQQENRRHWRPKWRFKTGKSRTASISVHFHVIVITVGSSGLCVFIQENNSTAVTDQTSTKPSKTADPDDLVYSSVTHSRPRKPQRAGDEDEVEYASVQHHRNTGNTTVVAGCQNGNTVSAGWDALHQV